MKKGIIFLCLLCICCMAVLHGCGKKADLILEGAEESAAEQNSLSAIEVSAQEPQKIYVYICGAVKNPGVYELDPDSRIYQLVELAGGMKKKADTQSVNLAEQLTDGQMVSIPEISDSGDETKQNSGQKPEGITSDGKVNINVAEAEELMTLTGIGEAKAQQIIAYREKNGSFQKIEDIKKVEGIKEGTFEKIKESITV